MRIEMWRRGGGTARAVMAAVLAVALAAPVEAQSGNGYLFGRPQGSVTLRGGFASARANSELFQEFTENLTLKKSDFSGLSLGMEFGAVVGEHFDLTADIGYMRSSTPSSYRKFVDNNDQEIEQVTTLRRVPIAANAKVYLLPRGRSIGRFAWIPNGVVPWVGAGAGTMWYDLTQEGDFIDFTTTNVRSDTFASSSWTPMAQAMAGVDVTLTPRLAVTGDLRYLWARSPKLSTDFVGYDPLDLSGGMLSLGLTVRL
jgi:opacity protein-like surface antigen